MLIIGVMRSKLTKSSSSNGYATRVVTREVMTGGAVRTNTRSF